MVARQILVLLVCVQIAEGQHDLSSEGAHSNYNVTQYTALFIHLSQVFLIVGR